MLRRTTIALFAALITGACASAGTQKYDSPDAMYARALQEIEGKHWTEATQLLERLRLEYPTFSRIQEARFQLGNAYFGKKEYLTAANEFLRLATDYPTGPYSDDARFRVCESYRELSPVVQRDQQYTQGAIDHCQALITYYPGSEFVPRAQQIVAEMTDKLAEKIYIGGEFYRNRGAYDSAIIYYENLLRQYPRTKIAPEGLLRLVEVYGKLGYKEEAQAARDRLVREYPESPAAKQVGASPAPATGS